MTGEPVPITESLGAAREALARVPDRQRPTLGGRLLGDDGPDDDELAAIRQRGAEEYRELRWSGSVPQRFVTARPPDFPPEVAADLTAWATIHPRPNLVLLGAIGVGKSHTACAAVYPDHMRNLEVMFLPVVELLDMLRPGGPDDAMDALCTVDRLVLDDLGTERPTDWTAERLYAVVNRRWLEERPIVATSNLEPDQLKEAVGERTFSRLCGSDALVVRLNGADRRFRRGS